jgi:cephalosporin-C deacetylase-like acetyl esterase
MPESAAFNNLMRAAGKALHEKDQPPASAKDWASRRQKLREAMFAAMGPFPDKPCDLEPKETGVLKRDGYRVEKLRFQSRPDVWVTANAYVPEKTTRKVPAVLCVHGHWAGARRDPVVQARCLGLVKLGFFVLVVDAFGSGERYTKPGLGTYHGALYGSPLWPAGLTLLGCQVYDNRRAVDYLLTRPEVDGDRLGVTGASGGGNQTMYAGALDDRFAAVVPVCSVGTYQAYLQAACCVCEVLPGALRFAEEGDVLALVAPRALLVINATKDAFQFSVAEAEKSLARAKPVFELLEAPQKLKHATFESPHAYNQPMREAMYGWMALWLKGEGSGKPVPEPKHTVEKAEDLAVFPDDERPRGFLYPPSLAAREAGRLLAKFAGLKADHPEDWESTAVYMKGQLRKQVFGDFPPAPKPAAKKGKAEQAGDATTLPLVMEPEPEMPLPVLHRFKTDAVNKLPSCVLLHLDGKAAALKHPVAAGLVAAGWAVSAPALRATGETKAAGDAVRTAPDHNSAEHALWVGRPLLGQWVFDVQCLLDWLAIQPGLDKERFAVAGVGQAGLVAVCAAALLDDRVSAAAVVDAPASYVTEQAYPDGTHMGLLAPGLLRVGDVPQLAALAAPRRLVVAGGVSSQGKPLAEKALKEAYAFTASVYKLHKAEAKLTLAASLKPEELAAALSK